METPRLNKTEKGSSGYGPLGFDYMNVRMLQSCINESIHLFVHLSTYVYVRVYIHVHECLHSLFHSCTYPFSKLNTSREHYLFDHKYLPSSYGVPGMVLDAGNLIVNQMARSLSSWSSESSCC